MCESETSRTSPMIKVKSGWGCISDKNGNVESSYVQKQGLTPQYRMVDANDAENKVKADAVKEFVSLMIGAFESGFVDKNNPTLAEIHRVAQNHIKDNYGIDTPNIEEEWGKEAAKECGLASLVS